MKLTLYGNKQYFFFKEVTRLSIETIEPKYNKLQVFKMPFPEQILNRCDAQTWLTWNKLKSE